MASRNQNRSEQQGGNARRNPQMEWRSSAQAGDEEVRGGPPRGNLRNANRMRQKREERNPIDQPNGWNIANDIAEGYEQATSQRKRRQQRPPKPSKPTEAVAPPRVITEGGFNDADFEIEGFSGMEPMQRRYTQNFDHSNFALIVERSYADLRGCEPTISRSMPFCMYMHYNTELLNAKLIDTDRMQNNIPTLASEGDVRDTLHSELNIHAPVAAYLENVGATHALNGDTIHMNLPPVAIPQLAIPAANAEPAIGAGSFGPVTADGHNVYEAYISPLVTRRAIEHTIAFNTQHNLEPNFQHFNH